MTIKKQIRGASALAFCAAIFAANAAHAVVWLNPLAKLDIIFGQPNVVSQTNNRLSIEILPTQNISGPRHNVDGNALSYLTRKSGLEHSLTIPIFYIHSFSRPSTLGIGFVNNNGILLLSSYQADLQVRPGTRIPTPCPNGHPGCFFMVPAITTADVQKGRLASAEVVAHELVHNFGLSHTYEPGLMNSFATPYYRQIGIASHLLTPNQVSLMLTSPFFQMNSFGDRNLTLAPFAVVPEPASWAMLIAGFGLVGAAMRRRVAERTGQPA